METRRPDTDDGELTAADDNHENVAPEAVAPEAVDHQQPTSSDGINRYPDRWGEWPDGSGRTIN